MWGRRLWFCNHVSHKHSSCLCTYSRGWVDQLQRVCSSRSHSHQMAQGDRSLGSLLRLVLAHCGESEWAPHLPGLTAGSRGVEPQGLHLRASVDSLWDGTSMLCVLGPRGGKTGMWRLSLCDSEVQLSAMCCYFNGYLSIVVFAQCSVTSTATSQFL